MSLVKQLRQLEGLLQEERGAQGRVLELLQAQEAAIRTGDGDGIKASGSGIESELEGEPSRRLRRQALVAGLAKLFGVPAELLSVTSIAERSEASGESAERLLRLRDELRESVLSVRKIARRIQVLANDHAELLGDILRTLVGAEGGIAEGGLLVNAEA